MISSNILYSSAILKYSFLDYHIMQLVQLVNFAEMCYFSEPIEVIVLV